jgi:excisionase family DNA binding protein
MTQRHVTVTEAGRILGVSRRTIQRRINAGELPTVEVGGVRRVVLDSTSDSTDAPSDTPSAHAQIDADVSHLRERVAALEAELSEVRQDRDRWYGHAQSQGATIDRLTVTLAQLGDRVIEQRVLPSPEEPSESRQEGDIANEGQSPQQVAPRPWWRFWER